MNVSDFYFNKEYRIKKFSTYASHTCLANTLRIIRTWLIEIQQSDWLVTVA